VPSNKNQHYVPRCHLKPFTQDEEGLSIKLFNVSRAITIENAPVKNQCSRDYFYGQSEDLEKAIQTMEGAYSEVVRRIRSHRHFEEGDARFLSSFWMFQHLRTEAIQQSILRTSRALESAIGHPVPQLQIDKEGATLVALGAFSKHYTAISDLGVVQLRNRTTVLFVTSDNPAVQTNRWVLSQTEKMSANFGMLSAGFLGLLPISSNILVLLYDKDVYSVAHQDKCVILSNESDVQYLNDHQLLNCISNIYFSGELDTRIPKVLQEIKARREDSGERVQMFSKKPGVRENRYYRTDKVDASTSGEAMLAHATYYPKPLAWPNFLHWRSGGYFFYNGSGVGRIRKAHLADHFGHAPFRKIKTGH
jgi:hypothetical protein